MRFSPYFSVFFSLSPLWKKDTRAGRSTAGVKYKPRTVYTPEGTLLKRVDGDIYTYYVSVRRVLFFVSVQSRLNHWDRGTICDRCWTVYCTPLPQDYSSIFYFFPRPSFIAIDYIPPIWRMENIFGRFFSVFFLITKKSTEYFWTYTLISCLLHVLRDRPSWFLSLLTISLRSIRRCVSLFFHLILILFFLSLSFSRLRALVDDGWFMLRVPRLYCCDSFSLAWWWWMINGTTHTHTGVFLSTLSGDSNCFRNNIAFSSLKQNNQKHSVNHGPENARRQLKS